MTNPNVFLDTPVLVEQSDERLAAVEDAKRTGQEFQSVGARGNDIVARDKLADAVREQSAQGSSDPFEPLPDYLVELKDNIDDEEELNREKAQQHHDYSAELAAAQETANLSDAEKVRKDPDYFAKRIAENNARVAEEFRQTSAQYAKRNADANEAVREEVRKLRPERVGDPDPITQIGRKAKITDISESDVDNTLKTKDRIIYGEDSFKQQAKKQAKQKAPTAPTTITNTAVPEASTSRKAKNASKD